MNSIITYLSNFQTSKKASKIKGLKHIAVFSDMVEQTPVQLTKEEEKAMMYCVLPWLWEKSWKLTDLR